MTTPAAADDGGPAPAGVPAGEARGLCTAPSPVFPAATPWLLIAAFVAVATATLRDYGVTWDEGLGDLYFGDVYLETFKSGGDPARLPPTPAKLPEHWGRPGEPDYDKSPLRFLPVHHWPVSNVVAAACGEVFHRRLGLLDPIDARHFGIVLLAALALAATWTFAKEVFGDGAAFAAVVLLGSYPEWFALSHDMVKDVGETAFYGWTLVAFHRAFTRGGELRWALAALALAAALGTKLNAVYAVATVAVWACVWALASALRRRRGIGSGPLVRHLLAGLVVAGVLAASFVGVRGALAAGGVDLVGLAQAGELDATWAFGFVVAIVPAALGIAWFVARRGGVELRRLGAFALATAVGGTLFVASWPWLWPAPAARLVEQLVTFAEVARRDAPDWQAYPWVQALLRTPPTMLAAAALGVIAAPFAVRRGKGAAVVLLLLWLLVPLMRCAAPSFRNYDGIRRFLEFLPALAIFAGAGTALIAAGAARLFVRRGAASGAPEAARRAGRRAAILATAVAAAPALTADVRLHPFQTTYANDARFRAATARVVRAATSGRVDLQELADARAPADLWASSYRRGLTWINRHAVAGASVCAPVAPWIVDVVAPTWLRPDLVPAPPGAIVVAADDVHRRPLLVARPPRSERFRYVMLLNRDDGWCDAVETTLRQQADEVHRVEAGGKPLLFIFALEAADPGGAETAAAARVVPAPTPR